MHIYRFGKIAGLCHKSGITNTKIFRDRAISKVDFANIFPYGTLGYEKKIELLGVPPYAEVVAAFWSK